MGGVQLFGMIKMLGLQKQDMRSNSNELAWFGYQVSMRILEVTICTLLAVIATTPLRSEPPNFEENSPKFTNRGRFGRFCDCFRSNKNHRQLDDDIYSEICTNNQSVRHMQQHQLQNSQTIGPGGIIYSQGQFLDPTNPYSTLRYVYSIYFAID